MTPEIKKQLQLFIAESERLSGDLAQRRELARWLIAESEKGGSFLPSFPSYLPSGYDALAETLTVLNYLQSAEVTARINAERPDAPLPRRKS